MNSIPRTLSAFLLVLFLLPGLATGQNAKIRDWNNQADPMHSAVGVHYGSLAGHGLSFRMPIKWYLYAQVGGGVWHVSDDKKHNLGFELNYLLRQDDRLRLFLGAGAGYFYHQELLDDSGSNESWKTTKEWNTGGGVGVEYLMGTRWAVQCEADFVHKGINGNITVAPQVGIHYYW